AADQIEPIFVDQRLARQAAERYFLDSGNILELRELAQQLALSEALVRLDVPGKVQPIDANGVDRSARKDQSHFRQSIHSRTRPSFHSRSCRLDLRPWHFRAASLTASSTSGYLAQRQRLPVGYCLDLLSTMQQPSLDHSSRVRRRGRSISVG